MKEKFVKYFLEIANWKIEQEASGTSVYAGQLFRYLEILEACQKRFDIDLSASKQRDSVIKTLSGSTKDAKTLVEQMKEAAASIIDDFSKQTTMAVKSQVGVSITFDDEKKEPYFQYSFVAEEVDYGDMLLLVFFNLVSNFNLEPTRFRHCNHKDCKRLYYQFKRKTMKYCSDICSNIARNRRGKNDYAAMGKRLETLRKSHGRK